MSAGKAGTKNQEILLNNHNKSSNQFKYTKRIVEKRNKNEKD